jgi:hypothetical protein
LYPLNPSLARREKTTPKGMPSFLPIRLTVPEVRRERLRDWLSKGVKIGTNQKRKRPFSCLNFQAGNRLSNLD